MRNKKWFLGIAALVLVFGLMLASCGKEEDDPGPSKPSTLANNATADQAKAKLEEIVAYCEANSGNVGPKASAGSMLGTWEENYVRYWSTNSASTIQTINSIIAHLK